jgi:hypothetical protein
MKPVAQSAGRVALRRPGMRVAGSPSSSSDPAWEVRQRPSASTIAAVSIVARRHRRRESSHGLDIAE